MAKIIPISALKQKVHKPFLLFICGKLADSDPWLVNLYEVNPTFPMSTWLISASLEMEPILTWLIKAAFEKSDNSDLWVIYEKSVHLFLRMNDGKTETTLISGWTTCEVCL